MKKINPANTTAKNPCDVCGHATPPERVRYCDLKKLPYTCTVEHQAVLRMRTLRETNGTPEFTEAKRRAQRELRRSRRKKGLCTFGNHAAEPGKALCADHAEAQNAARRKS